MNPPDIIKSVAVQRVAERNSIDMYLDGLADMPLDGMKKNDLPFNDKSFNKVDTSSKIVNVKRGFNANT